MGFGAIGPGKTERFRRIGFEESYRLLQRQVIDYANVFTAKP